MNKIDFIGDIHGHADKLQLLLEKLDYKIEEGIYRHPSHTAFFLGDFIDRGPDSPGVVDMVRKMIEAGAAKSVMGNHEFNAICFNTISDSGGYLRPHSIKNFKQHATTLLQYQGKQELYNETIDWFKTLPLYFENDYFRVVHACWDSQAIKTLESELKHQVLNEQQIFESVDKSSSIYQAVEITCKGKEVSLPSGSSFLDKDGTERFDIRIKWWMNPESKTFKEMSIVEGLKMNDIPYSSGDMSFYPVDAKPVFFGHYWLNGLPNLYQDNICCLDYSVAKDGYLVAYRFNGESRLSNENFVFV